MGEQTCSTEGCEEIPWPHEYVTNARVAYAARRWPAVGWALSLALWPHLERRRAHTWVWSASGGDADWEHRGNRHSLAEHKPLGAPGQWSWALAADYAAALRRGPDLPGARVGAARRPP